MTPRAIGRRWIIPAGAIGALALLGTWFMKHPEAGPTRRAAPTANARQAAPPSPPPLVEPVGLLPIEPSDARAVNEAVAFASGPKPAARPFTIEGEGNESARAVVCLASAVWYEAGDDPNGQRAVAQVVLNRVRHPAFPKSVCGVVLQGSELRTGCQFTFTCDGALARRPSDAAWARARALATRALTGTVAPEVGLATHYHTDWVVPYWSSSLDKIARVGTHLFFRWQGWWGTPPAFRGRYAGGEQVDARLPGAASLMDVAAGEAQSQATVPDSLITVPPPAHVEIPGVIEADLKGSVVRLADLGTNSFVLQVRPGAFAGDWATSAVTICRGRPQCTVLGYLQPSRIPLSLPMPREQYSRATFLYRRGTDASSGRAYWHCGQVPNIDPMRCIPGTEPEAAQTR